MPIPRTRTELVDLVTENYGKLRTELDRVDAETAERICVDEWSIRDVLAVRAWWTERVIDWVQAGRHGKKPVTPAPGYAWQETPRLNADTVAAARDQSYKKIVSRLDRGVKRALKTIDALSDEELLGTGQFDWAGKWPIARWISMNTSTQYVSARKYVRRALKT